MALGADLNLDANDWNWVLCLTLPLETVDVLQFSPRPYAEWIRYAIGTIIGAGGDLRPVPARSILWTTALASQPILPLYTIITHTTTRGEECSRSILKSHAQTSDLRALTFLEVMESRLTCLFAFGKAGSL